MNVRNSRITYKPVQVVVHYSTATEVYREWLQIRWCDFKKYGIRRRIDKKTGLPFLVMVMSVEGDLPFDL